MGAWVQRGGTDQSLREQNSWPLGLQQAELEEKRQKAIQVPQGREFISIIKAGLKRETNQKVLQRQKLGLKQCWVGNTMRCRNTWGFQRGKSNLPIDQKAWIRKAGDKEDSGALAEVSKAMKSCTEMEKSVGGTGLQILMTWLLTALQLLNAD